MTEKTEQTKEGVLALVQNHISGVRSSIKNLVHLADTVAERSQTVAFEQELVKMQEAANAIVGQLDCLRKIITAPSSNPGTQSNSPKDYRALVVDDNATNRRMLTQLLKRRGCQVSEAENGRIACELLTLDRFDIVFMDLSMPVMSGFEATTFIRQHIPSPASQVPIFAVTAHALAETQEACLLAGMNGFIAKPVNASELTKALSCLEPLTQSTEAKVSPQPLPLSR